MTNFRKFFYAIMVIFTVIGGSAYLFYEGHSIFALPLLAIGIWQAIAFLGYCELPKWGDQ